MVVKAIFVGIDRYLDPAIPELGGARRDALALLALLTDTIEGCRTGNPYSTVEARRPVVYGPGMARRDGLLWSGDSGCVGISRRSMRHAQPGI